MLKLNQKMALTNINNRTPLIGSLLRHKNQFSKPQLAVFVIVFGIIGYIIFKSFAIGPLVASLEAEQMVLPSGASILNDSAASSGRDIILATNGTANGTVNFPSSVNSLTIVAKGGQCSGAPAMTVSLDGSNVLASTAVSSTSWTSYSANLANTIGTGNHNLAISFSNDYTKTHGNKIQCSRDLYVDITNFYGPNPLPTPAPTVSLSVSPSNVTAGQASTLTWNSANADSCTASDAWSGPQSTQGSTSTGALNQTSTYTLSCSGLGGSTTAKAVVTVSSGSCLSSTTAWQNNPLSSQSGTFTQVFSLIPNAANIDADIGFSASPAGAYTDLATIVEFNTSGNIVARNGGGYSAVTPLAYSAGVSYSVRMVVNVPAHTYSVYVTPTGGSEVTIASNYSFRTEQSGVSQLGNWATVSSIGSEKVCGLPVNTTPPLPTEGSGQVGCVGPSCAGKLPAPDTSKGTKYYISNGGSLGNSGTSASSPWPFSQASASLYKPGDSVNFACGQSFGFLNVNVSGTSGLPVIFQTDGTCGQATFAGIDVPGRSWVTLYNIKSYVTGYLNSSYQSFGTTIALEVDAPSSHVTVQGSDLSTSKGVGSDAIAAGNTSNSNISYLTIDSTNIHDAGDTAVYLYGTNNLVQYSKFYNNGGKCPTGCGTHHIYMKAENSTFAFNDFGTVSSGQSLSLRRTSSTIYGNLFHDNDYPLSYFAEVSGGGTTLIYNNRFQNTNGYMIWIDGSDSDYLGAPNINLVWASNTIQGNSSDYLFPIYRNKGTFKAYNNIAMGSWVGAINGGSASVSQSNNLWFTASGIGAGPDYLLQIGSNAINTGTVNVSGLNYTNDCNGKPLSYCLGSPDIGARESNL
ncbi:hypothetical protein KW801_01360 [Candidatus Saccharibacteria bacterium]|nr:hypothetical protein [Candidatus Saccharibacteria bacterium]